MASFRPVHALFPAFPAVALLAAFLLPPPVFHEQAWRTQVTEADPALLYAPHAREGRFFNPWMPMEEKGLSALLRWRLTARPEHTEEEKRHLPAWIGKARERILALPAGDFLLWVGHATFLLRLDGAYWLTDPMFSERALLPRRRTPPGIALEDISALSPRWNVLISHNHYDHLDTASIRGLPQQTRFFVPLGLKDFFHDLGRRDVVEMDWWQAADAGGGTRIDCLPMQHWSRRIDQGFNETLWASYLITTPSVRIYFGGDTGYFIGHREFGRRFPGIDYALLPTTAYTPRWFMHYAHMNAAEAIAALEDLQARYCIPHQWGTFPLGDEPPGYPALDLQRQIAVQRADPSRFFVLHLGEIHPLRKRPVRR